MGVKKIVVFVTSILIGYLGFRIYKCNQPSTLPVLDKNKYWGPGVAPEKEDTSIRPFKVDISEDVLQDLKHRLESTQPFTPPLEGIQQQYGFNTNLLKTVVEFWKNDYKWREQETFLNKYPQFKTTIQGLDIHFIHLKPTVPLNVRRLPLLLLHGWPGSIREFYNIIPLLSKPQKGIAFEIIAPSLPGYGFSQAAAKPGFGSAEMAVIFKNLMKRLGHNSFYVQGGDWGSLITSQMSVLFPKSILGLHSNMCGVHNIMTGIKMILENIYPPLFINKQRERNMYPLSKKLSMIIEESGYFHIQATKPDTIGFALNESPAGLAAYILEKFSSGTDFKYKSREDGGLLLKFTLTELLDNIMIYWVTNSITTASRLYAESLTKHTIAISRQPISKEVPCACAIFPNEIAAFSDWILKDKYTNLIQSTDLPRGGHFAAMEEPELLSNDIFEAISKMEKLRL